jgi:hypothetical protein
MRYEQRLLTEIPVGGRFLLHAPTLEARRFYVVLKHYDGRAMEEQEDGTKRRSDEKVRRCRAKYIISWDSDGSPNRVTTTIDSGVFYVMAQEDVRQ